MLGQYATNSLIRATTQAQDDNVGPASPAQFQLISDLAKERGIDVAAKFKRPGNWKEAKVIIGWLKAQPLAKSPSPAAPAQGKNNWDDIPDGNYAYEYNGKTHFYRVSRRQGKGKWAGRTFVNVQERASSHLYRMEQRPSMAVLFRLREEGPEVCGLRFAEKLGKCRFCFEDLTDENNEYKKQGAGPVCGPKYLG